MSPTTKTQQPDIPCGMSTETGDPDSAGAVAERQSEISDRWTTARLALDERLEAIRADQAANADELAAARRDAVLGEDRDQAIGSLIGHQRALEAEAAEIAERLAVASREEQAAGRELARAQIAATAAAYVEDALRMAAEAARLDAAIDAWVRAGRELLAPRWAVVQACYELRTSRIDELMATASAQGIELARPRLEFGPAMEFRAGDLPAYGNDVDVPAHYTLEV